MNGAEHYAEAERLLDKAMSFHADAAGTEQAMLISAGVDRMVAHAQAHATLALAAATALADVEFTTRHDRSDWMRVTKSEATAPAGASS